MNGEYTVSTDKKEKIKVESSILSADWHVSIARGGGDAEIEVQTILVAEGSAIEIKGQSSKGKAPGVIKGKIFNNKFTGALPIPEKVDPGAEIWYEAKLPKHGLKMESYAIPAAPPLYATRMGWDRQEIHRGDIVKLQAQFEGSADSAEAMVIIYEYSSQGYHDSILKIPTVIKNRRMEILWEFTYKTSVDQIPTQAELQPHGLSYSEPHYFFVVIIDGIRIGVNQESGLLKFKDVVFIEMQLGPQSAANSELVLIAANGKEITATLDGFGCVALSGVPPGILMMKSFKPPSKKASGQPKAQQIEASVQKQLETCKYLSITHPLNLNCNVRLQTGVKAIIHLPSHTLLFDAHMHIQSNNCCPLPLQWEILASALYKKSKYVGYEPDRAIEDNRKSLNDKTAHWITAMLAVGRLGKIGRYTTDMIGKIYGGTARKLDMVKDAAWNFLSDEEIKLLYGTKKQDPDDASSTAPEKSEQDLIAKAANESDIEKLTTKTNEGFESDFVKNCAFYYNHTAIFRCSIALPMDMSFAHYWGKDRLPLYLSTPDAMYFIDDFVRMNVFDNLLTGTSFVNVNPGVLIPRNTRYQPALTEDPSFRSEIHLYPKMLAGDLHRETFSLKKEFDVFDEAKRRGTADKAFYIHFNDENAACKGLISDNKFCHVLVKVPLDSDEIFEDYTKQRIRTEGAAVEFPFQIVPFYHYDPRRHFGAGHGTPAVFAQTICANHSFFNLAEDCNYKTTLTNGTTIYSSVSLSPNKTLNSANALTTLLEGKLLSNESVCKRLFLHKKSTDGIFWGVKMYPRLGFAPDDFASYPHMKDFFTECQNYKIPITFHSSRGGMAAADYFNYQRYDKRMVNVEYDLKKADEYFSDTWASPANWENVLQQFPNLKLCFAHFGGTDQWKECHPFEKRYNDAPGKEKRDRYMLWVDKICKLIQSKPNVYTDISYFPNEDPRRPWKHDYHDIAEDMVFLLKKFSELKDRVMMGSDWYMIEKEKIVGAGAYYRRMFLMLQEVSKKVGYDAWHQFAVVNPMRYLGLIEEAKGSNGPFDIKTEVVEKFLVRLGPMLKNKDWKKISGCKGNQIDYGPIKEKVLSLLKEYGNVLDSREILRGDKLLIIP